MFSFSAFLAVGLLLTADPAPRLDCHGDPLPTGAVSRLGTVRLRHSSTIYSLAFSADGKRLASCGGDRTTRIWDAATGKELHCLTTGQQWSGCAVFSPDGRILASVHDEDRIVHLWDVATGLELRRFEGYRGRAGNLAFSPDGRLLAAIWAEQSPRNPDLKSPLQDRIHLWDVDSGEPYGGVAADQDVECLTFSPDGQLLAWAATDGPIHLWDRSTWKERRRLVGHQHAADSLSFSPDGSLLVSADNGGLHLWDVATGKERSLPVTGVANDNEAIWAAQGDLIASRSGPSIHLWQPAAGKRALAPIEPNCPLRALAFSPGGTVLATAGTDHRIRLWDTTTGKELQPRDGRLSGDVSVGFLGDGKTVITRTDHALQCWDPLAARELSGLETGRHMEPLALTPDGKAALVRHCGQGTQDAIHLQELDSGKELLQLHDADPPRSARWAVPTPDGKQLALVSFVPVRHRGDPSFHVSLRSAATGKPVRDLGQWDGWPLEPVFSPNGKVLAIWARSEWGPSTLRLWDVKTGVRYPLPIPEEISATYFAFSSDGRLLVTGGDLQDDHNLRVWDLATGTCVQRLAAPRGPTTSLAMSPDSRLLAVGERQGAIRLWELATGKALGSLEGHRGAITSLAFSGDGRLLISGSSDVTALVWDVLAGISATNAAPTAPPAPDLRVLWDELGESDAPRAYRAIRTMTRIPDQAAPFLHEQLRPVRAVDSSRLARLIADLDSEAYAVRARATDELDRLDRPAAPALRQALTGSLAPEARRRIEQLLEQLEVPSESAHCLRARRALQALEQMDDAEARRVLAELAHGAPEAWLTQEAQASLQRLARRPAR